MRSRSPRRWAQALAVALPLGLEPAGEGGLPPRVTVPPEVVADAGTLGAVGMVFHAARPSEVCAAVALREGEGAPRLVALRWRPTAGPSRSVPLALEELPGAETPEGFTLWYACSPAGEPAAGAALSALLVEPGTPVGEAARRRLELAAGPHDVWRWRTVEAIEARADLATAPQRPRLEQRSRGVAVYAAKPAD